MGAWDQIAFLAICYFFVVQFTIAQTVQITSTEFAEELHRYHNYYIEPFRRAVQELIKLPAITDPIGGNDPEYEGQETVRGYILEAANAVDAVMSQFIGSLGGPEEHPQNPTSGPASEVVLKYNRLKAVILDYFGVNVVTNPKIWTSEMENLVVPMDVWVLINKLRMTTAACCNSSVLNGNQQTLQWILNGRHDEEAGLWTMHPEDTKYRIQVLGAMVDGLKNLKIPAIEEIQDIKDLVIDNNFPAAAYESLPPIIARLEPTVQAFVTNLQDIRYNMSGIHIEFTNRFMRSEWNKY